MRTVRSQNVTYVPWLWCHFQALGPTNRYAQMFEVNDRTTAIKTGLLAGSVAETAVDR